MRTALRFVESFETIFIFVVTLRSCSGSDALSDSSPADSRLKLAQPFLKVSNSLLCRLHCASPFVDINSPASALPSRLVKTAALGQISPFFLIFGLIDSTPSAGRLEFLIYQPAPLVRSRRRLLGDFRTAQAFYNKGAIFDSKPSEKDFCA